MQTVNNGASPEESLEQKYFEQALKMYEACEAGAAKHTGPDSLFGGLTTDIARYPLQHIDCQFVPAEGKPIAEVIEFGNLLSPGLSEQTDEFIETNEAQLDEVRRALDAGYNVAIAIPTHAQVHDLAFPLGQVTMGLTEKYGEQYDRPDDRFEIFAKSLAWYDFIGQPVPELARMLGNTAFTLPHSRSGDHFDAELKDEFNRRSLKRLWSHLDEGGKIIALATAGATNTKQTFRGKVVAECQAPIHSGTARLLANERNLVLPVACYLDEGHRYHSRVGNLVDISSDDPRASEEQCLQIGIWAAKQYQELSGVKTIQAPTRAQMEHFINADGEEISNYLSKGRRLIDFIRMIGSSNPEEQPRQ